MLHVELEENISKKRGDGMVIPLENAGKKITK